MAPALNFALLMVILAALTCEAQPMQESTKAENKHHVHIPGINTTSQAAAVIRHGTEPKSVDILGRCQSIDISIDQQPTATAPGHAPAFQVQIVNTCACPVSHLILNCPNFATAEPINPTVMKTQGDGTCLVKNGQAIGRGEIIGFQYHQSFKETLAFRSAAFGC